MENIRTTVLDLSNKVIDFAKKMESDDTVAKGVGAMDILQESTSQYNRREYYALFSGEVKAGKSSLINSILGEDICTVDGGVCTNTCTMVRYGDKEKITVYYASKKNDGSEPSPQIIERNQIEEYVSEKKNRDNKKNVRLIVVELPNEHLKTGLVLIDTPGLGSLNPLHAATTFSMAPMADVIFLIASSESELTESEISYMNQLLDCSKCKRVVHVLTHMDQGEPSKILEINKHHLSSTINWEDFDLQFCMVSNTNLKKYKAGIINDYSTTGFDNFFRIIEKLESSVELIMAKRQLECINGTLDKYSTILNTLLQSFSSPEKGAEKKRNIENAARRLKEIKGNTNTWKIELNGELKKLNIRANNRIKDNFEEIKKDVENKLQMDEYLENPKQLGGLVSAEVVKKNTSFQDYLAGEFASTYGWLKTKTGLSVIQDDLNSIGGMPTAVEINKEISVDKVAIYRNAILGNVFMYGTVGGALIGGIVGGIIGTFVVPGAGTLAGAQIGATIASAVGTVIGSFVAFVKGKERVKQEKRQKIMNIITPQLTKTQSDMSAKVAQIITDGETKLFIAFTTELDCEINRCSNIIKGLDSDSLKRKQISEWGKECNNFQSQSTKLQNGLSI